MSDPVIFRTIAVAVSILFFLAAAHKWENRLRFMIQIEAYKLLPRWSLELSSTAIPLLEYVLAFSWLAVAILGSEITTVTVTSVILLCVYTLGILINIAKGRNDIDCGCGDSKSIQRLSKLHLVRNLLLIFLVACAALPMKERSLSSFDYFSMLTGVIFLVLFYGAFNQLIVNNNIIKKELK